MFNFKQKIPTIFVGFILFIISFKSNAQCGPEGSAAIAWGTQTVIPTSSSAGGPPSAVTSNITTCNSGNFQFTTTISETNGNVYDAIRSGTNGIYGSGKLSLTLDNVDGGGGTTTYNAGNSITTNFNFQSPVLLNDFIVVDLDYVSSFQDKVTVSAKDINGINVALNLSVYTNSIITINGQSATATTQLSLADTDDRGWLKITSITPIKSLDLIYIAGPDVSNPSQQAIAVTTFSLCCPPKISIAGSVKNDCDINGNGALISSLSGSQLYAILVNTSTNLVASSQAITSGNYNFIDQVGNIPYTVLLRREAGTIGSTPPTLGIPATWAHVWEIDSSPNGSISLAASSTNITGRNFGVRGVAYPSAFPSSNSPVCVGSSIIFNETGVNGTTYSWSGPNGFANNTRTPSISNATTNASGTYILTVGNNLGCSVSASIPVTVNPLPIVSAPIKYV